MQGGARACGRRAEQRRARVEQLCVGVEQRQQGLRSVTPSQVNNTADEGTI